MALDMNEVLGLAEALNKRRDGDRGTLDLLNEVSTALAEHVEVLKRIGDRKQAEPLSAKDIAAAIGDALKEAMASLPAPTVQFTAPEAPMQILPPKRKGADIKFDTAPNGAILGCKVTFF